MTNLQDFQDLQDSQGTRDDQDLGPHGTDRYQRVEQPYFWRAPFAGQTYREFGFVLGSLVTATAGFSWAVTMFAFGVGTLVTALGLPVLALLLAGARGFGAMERGRARRLLGYDVPRPAPVRRRRPGAWGAVTAGLADPAGWRAVLYQVVMFPWQVFGFVLSVTLWAVGWVSALYPLYAWVFPRFVGRPGLQLFDSTDSHGVRHVYYLSAPWQIAGLSTAGLLLVFLTPAVLRALNAVNRAAIRGLLGA
ncbi:sensor domain-containing protein [Kitasatospora sp. NPDC052896]|uniref:sensor domain-containing protein n=1 Tax=Kitasatospora sp. NPDC052896 TaxID=3364061 RepID=UPI0037C8673F